MNDLYTFKQKNINKQFEYPQQIGGRKDENKYYFYKYLKIKYLYIFLKK